MSAPTLRVTVLPETEHAFLEAIFTRTVQAGLIDPDELSISGVVWTRLRNAATRAIEEPKIERPEDATPILEDL